VFAQKKHHFIKQFYCFFGMAYSSHVYQNKTLFLGRLSKNGRQFLTISIDRSKIFK